ncbi:unnamed protein product [Amaranthus hypochondriacus]
MSTERNESSVLAKLMCINKPLSSNTTYQRQRVFSENYFQNIASVARREKVLPLSDNADFDMDLIGGTGKSFHVGRSSSLSSSSFGYQNRKKSLSEQTDERPVRVKGMSSSFSSSTSTFGNQKRKNTMSDGIRLPETRMSSSLSSSTTTFGNQKRKNSMSDGMRLPEKRSMCSSSFDSIRSTESSLSSKEIAKQVTEQVKHSVWHSCIELFSMNPKSENSTQNVVEEGLTSPPCSLNSEKKHEVSCFAPAMESTNMETQKAEKQLSERWKKRKFSHEERNHCGYKIQYEWFVTSSKGRNNGCPGFAARYLAKPVLFPSAWIPRSRARQLSLDWCLRPSKRVSMQCNDSVDNQTSESLILNDSVKPSQPVWNRSECSKVVSLCTNCDLSPVTLESEEVVDEENDKTNTCIKLIVENLSRNAETGQHQLKIKGYDSEHPRSPVSSLEGPENLSLEPLAVSELENDGQGLHIKLLQIDTMSFESASEGPGMVVSSDEGDDPNSVCFYQNDPQIIEFYQTRVEECSNFSYVVDVVAESGLQMRDLEEMGSSQSRNLFLRDNVLDPLVFSSLEKKYGKCIPREKSERRLLFDRLNLGLVEIFKPSIGLNTWKKPVAKRFRASQKGQELEEVLWSVLVNQQDEVKKDSFDKVCQKEMKWLDLEEDTDLIIQELQSLLVDELLEEFLCM